MTFPVFDYRRLAAPALYLGCAAAQLAGTSAVAADAPPAFETIVSFDAAVHGAPLARPIWAAGALYGTTRIGSTTTGVLYRVDPQTKALTVVHSFPATASNGVTNHYPLVLGLDGALYGTRSASVVSDPPSGDEDKVGQLYRLPLSGIGAGAVQSVPLKSAEGQGFAPISALYQGADGTFYGATYSELFKVQPDGSGAAVMFQEAGVYATGIAGISDNGHLFMPAYGGTISTIDTVAATRTEIAVGVNLATPTGIFARGSDGKFYGTDKTSRVYQLTDQSGSLTDLYTFVTPDGINYPDGNQPLNYLAVGYDGNVYGVTNGGGTNNKGVVFRILPSAAAGERFTKLHDFGSGTDGAYPTGIAQGKDGKLYGTTSREGAGGAGTLFSIDVGIVPPVPAITTFAAAPQTLTLGDAAVLSWQSTNTASCSIEDGEGWSSDALAASGELSVTPEAVATVTYTLSCVGSGDFADQTATRTVSIEVEPKLPVITAFSATPQTLELGLTTQLSWQSADTSACTIADGLGWTSGAQTSAGQLTVTPTQVATITYTLNCTGSGAAAEESATQTLQVTVSEKPKGGGGGAMAPAGLLVMATLMLWRRRSTRNRRT